MLGGAEYVAEACQETLEQFDHQVTLHTAPNFSDIPQNDQIWLVCTSTYGAGDYPDNLHAFISDLQACDQNLNHTRFFVIGLGDSNYDTFCYAAKNIEKLLLSKGCVKASKLLTLDMKEEIDPEDEAQQWIKEINDQLS